MHEKELKLKVHACVSTHIWARVGNITIYHIIIIKVSQYWYQSSVEQYYNTLRPSASTAYKETGKQLANFIE